jgi:hypothetical protein
MIKKVFVAVIIVAVLATVAIIAVYNKPHQSVDNVDKEVTAIELIKAFDNNEIQANETYLDKVIEVKGKVRQVIKQENAFIVLLGDDSSLMSGVSCTLDDKDDSVAYGLKAGDEVAIRGICTGFLLDVVLVNCKIVNQ